MPWCTIGDMNNIVAQIDKKGGALYPHWLLYGFSEMLNEAGLKDVELYGHQFTWERGRDISNWLEIKLDKAMANNLWFDLFPLAKLYNLEGSPSDHSPIFLEPMCRKKLFGKRHFKFENARLVETLCKQIVKDTWANNSCIIAQKVKQCGEDLS